MLKLSQRKIAEKAGCSQSYICQIETGVRTVSLAFAKKLETILKLKPGCLRDAEFRRGRPPCSSQARKAILEISRAHGPAPRPLLPLGPPRYPRPDRINGLENPLYPLAPSLGHQAHLEVVELEKLRPKQEHFWRQLNAVPFDSSPEKRFQVRFGLTGADLTGVSLARLGSRLPGANGKTGRPSTKASPAYILESSGLSMALFPQKCVGTSVCHRWPDSLVIAALDGRRVTAVIEIDGDKYHQDGERDDRRTRELDVPVLRIPAGQVGDPGLINRVIGWVRSLFPV